MFKGMRRGALVSVLAVTGAAIWASSASAAITPALSLDQSAGTAAGGTANLGMDLSFSPTGSDSPDQMTIVLPPGLLANASIDGGACLTTLDLSNTDCQVGTGTVTAEPLSISLAPINESVSFDLAPPPAPGDLAGLAVNDGGTQIGTTAPIVVRPSGDPNGVGVTIDLVLPDTTVEDGLTVPISITQIDSTFDGLRYPTTCPSTPANVSVSVNSYDDSTAQTVSAPLSVTGCSTLPYAPKVTVSAVNAAGARQVQLTTTVTQAADETPSKSLSLSFPGDALAVNLGAAQALCTKLSSGTCTSVGTVTAASPLYPTPLTAKAYLTGTVAAPTLTLMFPAPFPLTLVGTVNLDSRTTTFTGLPDIPLTSLALTLNGGPTALFNTNCRPATGTVMAEMVDQNGDKTVNTSAGYTIAGCSAVTVTTSTGSTGSGASGRPTISSSTITGLASGHPKLRFKVRAGRNAAKLMALTVRLSQGLSFVSSGAGVVVSGAGVKSVRVAHGALVITLRKAVASLSVTVTGAIAENRALALESRTGKVRKLRLTVVTVDTRHRHLTVTGLIKVRA